METESNWHLNLYMIDYECSGGQLHRRKGGGGRDAGRTVCDMSYIWTLLQVALFLGVLGYGAYYMTKKTKKNIFRKQGENGLIQMKDGLYVNQHTGAYLFEVDGRQVFTVFSQNGVQSIQLTERSFTHMLQETLQEEHPDTAQQAKE